MYIHTVCIHSLGDSGTIGLYKATTIALATALGLLLTAVAVVGIVFIVRERRKRKVELNQCELAMHFNTAHVITIHNQFEPCTVMPLHISAFTRTSSL